MNQSFFFRGGLCCLSLFLWLASGKGGGAIAQVAVGKRAKVSDKFHFVSALSKGDSTVVFFRVRDEGSFTGEMKYVRFNGVETAFRNDSLRPCFTPGDGSQLWRSGPAGIAYRQTSAVKNKATGLTDLRYEATTLAGFPEPSATASEQVLALSASKKALRQVAVAPVFGKPGGGIVRAVGNTFIIKDKKLIVRQILFDPDGSAAQAADHSLNVAAVRIRVGSKTFATTRSAFRYATSQGKSHQDIAVLYTPRIYPRYRESVIEPALFFRKGEVCRFSFSDGTLLVGSFTPPPGKAYTSFHLIPSSRGQLIGVGLCTAIGKDSLQGICVHAFTPNYAEGTMDDVQSEVFPFYVKQYPFARTGMQGKVELVKQFAVKTLAMQDGTGDVVIALERRYQDLVGTLYAGYVRVYRISPGGELRWSVMVPKKQSLAFLRADFASFLLYEENGKVVLLTNDQEGNLGPEVLAGREAAMSLIVPRHQGGCVVKVVLAPDGTLSREVVMPAIEVQKINSMLYTAAGFMAESQEAKWVLLLDRTPNVGGVRMLRIPVKP